MVLLKKVESKSKNQSGLMGFIEKNTFSVRMQYNILIQILLQVCINNQPHTEYLTSKWKQCERSIQTSKLGKKNKQD
jgi:hypothetical protein